MPSSVGKGGDAASMIARITVAYGVSMIIAAIVSIVLYIHTALWIHNIDRTCTCAVDWRRRYVTFFPLAAIAASVFVIPFLTPPPAAFVSVMVMVGWIVFVIAALQYVKHVRATGCACADTGPGPSALHASAYVPVVSWTLTVLFMLSVSMVLAFIKQRGSYGSSRS
jgi:hypothetical protein